MNLLRRICNRFRHRDPENVAILGIDYQEYDFARTLEASGKYRVLFFIDENPWNYRNRLGNGVIRSLSDLPPLCDKHAILKVFYFDEQWLEKVAPYHLPLVAAQAFSEPAE